jgi:hypothetical protein
MLTHIRCAILIQATEFLNLIPKHRQYSIAFHAIPNGGKNVISIWLFFMTLRYHSTFRQLKA